MSDVLRLGIAGLGTVGVGVIKLVANNADTLTARAGSAVAVSAVSARSKSKDRAVDLTPYAWEDDAVSLAARDDVDVYVELIGGDSGMAYDSVVKALTLGKTVVTANKALVAVHGVELTQLVEKHGGKLYYEAAVAGGIPAIKMVREGLAANEISSGYGILNGTCNYILTEMEANKRSFDDVLQGAIDLGYAEVEPSVDVDGWDAAHKLAILAAISFGGAPDMAKLDVSGIRQVTLESIEMADELGYKIKLLGVASVGEKPFVAACAVPKTSSIAGVDSSFNAVVINGDPVDEVMIRGRGAGEGPTASAVVADIVDIARGISPPLFGGTPMVSVNSNVAPMAKQMVLFQVQDEAGVMAAISEGLSQSGLSVESMLQRANDNGSADVLIVTHPATADAVKGAESSFQGKSFLKAAPLYMRVIAS